MGLKPAFVVKSQIHKMLWEQKLTGILIRNGHVYKLALEDKIECSLKLQYIICLKYVFLSISYHSMMTEWVFKNIKKHVFFILNTETLSHYWTWGFSES